MAYLLNSSYKYNISEQTMSSRRVGLKMDKLCSLITIALFSALASTMLASAGDPEILHDFVVPTSLNPSKITQQYFTYTNFCNFGGKRTNFTGTTTALVTKATNKEFPALEGQSVSIAKIIYPPSGINPLHTHPRSAELLILLEGVLEVGFVDSTNKLFKQTLQANDLFIFPKGLVHYQLNVKSDSRAVALGVFGSSNAGTVSIPGSVFGSGMSPKVLAKSFKSDEATISKVIKANKMK